MQVDHLDAAHTQLQASVCPGRVSVAGALGGLGRQTEGKSEHLVAHDGDHLKDTTDVDGDGRPQLN